MGNIVNAVSDCLPHSAGDSYDQVAILQYPSVEEEIGADDSVLRHLSPVSEGAGKVPSTGQQKQGETSEEPDYFADMEPKYVAPTTIAKDIAGKSHRLQMSQDVIKEAESGSGWNQEDYST